MPHLRSHLARRWPIALLAALLLAAPAGAQRNRKAAAPAPQPAAWDDALFEGLEWREIGPYRGGRSAAVAGIPSQREVYYFGATGGGVWKTGNGGGSWENVSDGFFGGSIGAVEVSPWDPNVIYVGGGEKTVRGNVSHGNGVWKSVDAGKSWTHVGLADSRHIPRIRSHPRDPDRVYVAALGHLFGPNEERGVYRSKDGGATWERVLYVDAETGAVDLVMDPTNPRVLYASFWRVKRTPWSLESGGPGSSLWKSADGGDSWERLSENKGFPKAPLGIIGITVSPSDPENLYAIVEAEEGGVLRSRDGGESWTKVNEDRSLRQRAWYYTRIVADPADAESVYVLNVRFWRSKDGGKTFSQIDTPHGDNHDLWIDPGDPLRMVQSNDGGANVSYDGGETWSVQSNQPTAQFYRVSTDNDFPYRLLGGQQDNSAVRIRSRSAFGGAIGTRDWEPTAGGESGHIVAKPDEPDVVYGGSYGGFLVRYDHRTGERRAVNVWPDNPMGWGAAELRYRFQWNYPIFFSPHDPNVLYAAGNVLFKSTDEGASWEDISGDLTRNDKSKMGPSGGPITKDNTSVEYYGTIFAAAESHHEPGVLWTGSDDGMIFVSRDGGTSWSEVTPPRMPEWMQINSIDVHPFEPGGLYVAGTRYKLDDFRPYLYKTTDYGATWTEISHGIPEDQFTRVVRADPGRPGLLYAGTEAEVHVSFDDGSSWRSLQLELPVVPITDLAVKNGDLVAATQGRGFWILDDLSVLHQLDRETAERPARLLEPRPAYRLGGGGRGRSDNAGANPPSGVLLHYWLGAAVDAEAELRLEILDGAGEVIRFLTRKPADGAGGDGDGDDEASDELPVLEADRGLHRAVWDLSYPPAETFPGMVLWNGSLDGPTAVPGSYQARLTVGDWSAEAPVVVEADPRSSTGQEDLERQFEFHLAVRDKLTEVHREIARIRTARQQIEALEKRLADREGVEAVTAACESVRERLDEIEKALYQTQNRSRQDPLNFPIRLNDKLAGLMRLAAAGDYAPTAQMIAVRDELVTAIDAELDKARAVWSEALPALNAAAREAEIEAVIVPEEEAP